MATINDPNVAANIAAVKAASTAPVATDPALVVALSPNTSAVNLGKVQITDGTDDAQVTAASTAAVAADKAMVVAISPNMPATGQLRTDLINVAGSAVSTAASGVQKVGIVGNANAAIDGAIGSAPPANAVQIAPKAATANPTNATAGNAVALMADKAGRPVMTLGHVRELVGIQTTTITVNTETTIVTAGGAGVFNDLTALIISQGAATATVVTIKDATAGTTRMVIDLSTAIGPVPIPAFAVPIPQAAANNNWTATCSVASTVHITAVFVKNL